MVDIDGKKERMASAVPVRFTATFQVLCAVPLGTECIVRSSGHSDQRHDKEFFLACNGKRAKILDHHNGSCVILMLEGTWKDKAIRGVRPEVLCLTSMFVPESAHAIQTHTPACAA